MNKFATIFLVCQLALALAAPAVEQHTVTTNNMVENSGGQRDVQKLLDELERNHVSPTPTNVIKKTTTTTTIEEPQPDLSVTESEQLQEFMKDPKFVQQLQQLLFQFLNMYNSMNTITKGQTTTKTINEDNADINTLLRNPSFVAFLSNIFNADGPSGFFAQLFNQKQPTVSKTTTTEVINNQENINGHSRPVEPPQVTITHVESSNNEVPVVNDVDDGTNAAESLLEELNSSVVTAPVNQDRNKVVKVVEETVASNSNPPIDNRYNDNSQVTITHVGNKNFGSDNSFSQNGISSSEALLDELQNSRVPSNKVNTVTESRYTTNPNPSVVIQHVKPTTTHQVTEDWTNVPSRNIENTAELKQQAKNAKFQFATQIDDNINGNFQQRAEIRQGGVLYGKSSYDDGNFWRTTYYEADDNGFRITKEEVRPSQVKLTGQATVQTLVDGNLVNYHITENDIGSTRRATSRTVV